MVMIWKKARKKSVGRAKGSWRAGRRGSGSRRWLTGEQRASPCSSYTPPHARASQRMPEPAVLVRTRRETWMEFCRCTLAGGEGDPGRRRAECDSSLPITPSRHRPPGARPVAGAATRKRKVMRPSCAPATAERVAAGRAEGTRPPNSVGRAAHRRGATSLRPILRTCQGRGRTPRKRTRRVEEVRARAAGAVDPSTEEAPPKASLRCGAFLERAYDRHTSRDEGGAETAFSSRLQSERKERCSRQ